MNLTTTNSSNDIDLFSIPSWQPKIEFSFFLTLQLPSFCCTILILYYFKWNQLKNQIYGLLIIINALIVIVELSIALYFLYEGTFYSNNLCTSWITCNYSLFLLSVMMMAWTSIERYLFIYHEQIIIRHTILLHYAPIICILLYCPLFYIGVIVIYQCKSTYNIRRYVCGGACYESEPILGMIDWLGNTLCSVIIIFLVNVILIVRHAIQRRRMKGTIITAHRRHQWHRSIKLSMQLLSVAILYMIAWIPYSLTAVITIFNKKEQVEDLLSTFFVYLPYLQALLLPYICILFIPDIKQKFLSLFTLLLCKKNRHGRTQIHAINKEQKQIERIVIATSH